MTDKTVTTPEEQVELKKAIEILDDALDTLSLCSDVSGTFEDFVEGKKALGTITGYIQKKLNEELP